MLASISAVIAALAAWFTAWLLYRTRPLAIRAMEMHSQKLQIEVLPRWKDLISSNFPKVHEYNTDKRLFSQTISSMQEKPLFKDLMNHVPMNSSLQSLWQDYIEKWDSLENNRITLAIKIKENIQNRAIDIGLKGVKSGQALNINYIREELFVRDYYEALIGLAEGDARNYQNLKEKISQFTIVITEKPYQLKIGTVIWVFLSAKARASKARGLLTELVDELPTFKPTNETTTFLEMAQQLKVENHNLMELSNQILKEIDFLASLPLLPNPDCPLLKASTYSIWPNWLIKISQRFPSKQSYNKPDNNINSIEMINPLTIGLLFFAFGLALWGQDFDNPIFKYLGVASFLISLLLGSAVLINPLRKSVQNKWIQYVIVFLFPVAILAYSLTIFIPWIHTFSTLTKWYQYFVFSIGYFWIFIVIIVETSLICKRMSPKWGLFLSIIFLITAAVYFCKCDWQGGLVLSIFGIGILAKVFLSRWKVWDRFSL